MRLRLALGLSLFTWTAAAQTPGGGELPPSPTPEGRRGLSPAERQAVEQRNGSALGSWLGRLTKEQRAAWYAAKGAADPQTSLRIGAQKLPANDSGYSWQSVARGAGLNAAETACLARDKILIEDLSYKQSFEVYNAPARPVFITSDSLLNAFHVLFEDSFHALEARRAFELRLQLERVVAQARELMRGPRNGFAVADLAPGWRHAQLIVGPALRLLGSKPEICDANVRDEINRQVELIRRAEVHDLPRWLGPPARTLLTIDYRRFKPIGFYTASESLRNYFRAVRWLQSIPLRCDRDDELTAIGLLGYATMEERSGAREFFRRYHAILGRPDDPSLEQAAFEFQNFLLGARNPPSWKEALVAKRRWLLRAQVDSGEFRKLVDTNRLPPDAGDKLAEIQFRVLSAYRLPDSLMLARTATPGKLPSGLAVAVLLGSDFARAHLPNVAPTDLDAALTAAREDWRPAQARNDRPSLYDDYLGALSALCAPAESDAPDFMRGEPWAAKSCLTVLGSWAQMRHTFTLQAKESANYLGLVDVPPGFVEPNPEFFRRVADLCERAVAQFDAAGLFPPSAPLLTEELRRDAQYLETLKREAERFETGARPPDPRHSGLRQHWEVMKGMARRLEAMAHKQLRRQSWTPEENEFLKKYGEQLAFTMGYDGNSWLTPRDNAPRWATVASDPNTAVLLAVGVGRPRLLHVLYPWQGGEILCTGSVMSYYEYPETKRLTDEAWKAKLDSTNAPSPPDWLAPITAK